MDWVPTPDNPLSSQAGANFFISTHQEGAYFLTNMTSSNLLAVV